MREMPKKQRSGSILNKYKTDIIILVVFAVIGAAVWGLHGSDFQVLNPGGEVAQKERNLLVVTVLLGLLVVIPVFVMTFVIAWRYREGNDKAKYSPELGGNKWAETIWWTIPCIIILSLAIIAWQSSHSLDPSKKLVSSVAPVKVQVIALDWRWLFIYPDYNIATLNYVEFPENTPVNFEITADAPMNSFWIPKLGGQIYAMPGMSTQLSLKAKQTGVFRGSSANLSGKGFSDMDFSAKSVSKQDFGQWIMSVKKAPVKLTVDQYLQISKPSTAKTAVNYSDSANHLYDKVVMKYMMPGMDMHGAYHD
jgi:cytochrome o ubiquinol oxidase subunit 2